MPKGQPSARTKANDKYQKKQDTKSKALNCAVMSLIGLLRLAVILYGIFTP